MRKCSQLCEMPSYKAFKKILSWMDLHFIPLLVAESLKLNRGHAHRKIVSVILFLSVKTISRVGHGILYVK